MNELPGGVQCILDDVLITRELAARPSRPPDYEAESHALGALAAELAANPRGLLQKVVDTAMSLCRADSAGVSIFEPDGGHGVFRWHAVAGAFTPNLGGTMPREMSPCGDVMTRNEVMLFDRAARYFPALRGVEPPIYENLLAPWPVAGAPAGTLWVIGHTPERHFDAEDARLLANLARFAAAAWQSVLALDAAEGQRTELERRVDERTRALRESEVRQAYLLALSDALRTLFDPAEIRAAASRLLAGYLGPERSGDSAFDDLLYDGPPQEWPPAEIAIVKETAERTWAAIARARTEAALRASEQRYRTLFDSLEDGFSLTRQAFLVRLGDALRPLRDPVQVQEEAARILGEHLGVSRVAYGEVDDDDQTIVVARNYTAPGVAPVTGRFRMADFGAELLEALLDRRTVVLPDIAASPALSQEERAAYAALGIAALAGVPLNKEGRFVGTLVVHHHEPRAWTDGEIELIRETAERTWAAVERARAEAALRASQERLQKAISIETAGVLFFRLDGAMLDANAAFQRMSGYTVSELRALPWSALTPPEFMEASLRAAGELAARGETAPYEKQMVRRDGSRWWGLFAPARIAGSDGECVEFIIDITERKRREAHAAFLAEVTEELSRLTEEEEITTRIGAKIAAWLGAAECSLSDAAADAELPDALRAGEPAIARDAVTIAFFTGREPRHLLTVRSATPRQWREDEIVLLRELAERIFPRIARVRAVEELRASEARLQAVTNLVPDLLWSNDADGVVDWFNDRWLEYTGDTRDAALRTGGLGRCIRKISTRRCRHSAARSRAGSRSATSSASARRRASTAGSWCRPSRCATGRAASCAGSAR